MSWYNALTIITGLWTRIDLTEARKPVSMNTVRDYVRRSRNGMTRASLSFSTMSGDDMLSYILSHAKGLKHLDINFGDALDGPKLLRLAPFLAALRVLVITSDIDIHFDTVWQLLRLCKNLTRAEFHSVQELTVEQEWSDDMSNIRSLTINCSADQSSSIAFLNFVSTVIHGTETQSDNTYRPIYFKGSLKSNIFASVIGPCVRNIWIFDH